MIIIIIRCLRRIENQQNTLMWSVAQCSKPFLLPPFYGMMADNFYSLKTCMIIINRSDCPIRIESFFSQLSRVIAVPSAVYQTESYMRI